VDTLGLAVEVRIGGAHNDPRMAWLLQVESYEVTPVPRKDCPTIGCGDPEDFGIGSAPVRQSRLAGRRGIMSEPAQSLDDLVRKVFVGEQEGHGLCCPCSST